MVASTQGLTSLSPFRATSAELQERLDASLVQPSSEEPLNSTPLKAKLGRHWRREIHPAGEQARANSPVQQRRVPVVDSRGIPPMPCTAVRARLLIKRGKARPKWSKLSVFYVQLCYSVEPKNQLIAVGQDPGSEFEGLSVVGTKYTVLNVMSETVDWVKDVVKQRRQMRRARRYRKTRRRAKRFDNRRRPNGWIPPSTKARWDVKLRIVRHLAKVTPISHVVLEEDKAITKREKRKWNENFSPIQNGGNHYLSEARKTCADVSTIEAHTLPRLREKYGLSKSGDKAERSFHSHCVDAWCMAASITGAENPTDTSIHYTIPLRFHRRQLHRLEPGKGGTRKRYGGTISLGLKKGTLVKHVKHSLCYVGGNLRNRLSLHNPKTGRRITQNAKRSDFKILTRIAFRTQLLPRLKSVGFLG